MESNVCYGCRFGSVKIEVCVPEKCSFQEFVGKTRSFSSDLKAHTGQKPIHYTLTFDSESNSTELAFNVKCQCILNVNQRDCSNFTYEDKNCRVKHLQQNKPQTRETQIEVAQTI